MRGEQLSIAEHDVTWRSLALHGLGELRWNWKSQNGCHFGHFAIRKCQEGYHENSGYMVVIWWLYGGEQWSSNLFDPYASHVSDCW
jgi:hypothetical protein